MPISYAVLEPQGFIAETWTGEIEIDEVRRHWAVVLGDPACLALGRTLADLRDATLLFSEQELYEAVQEMVVPVLLTQPWTTAIVLSRSKPLRMASRYATQVAGVSHDAIFSDIEAARLWLLQRS